MVLLISKQPEQVLETSETHPVADQRNTCGVPFRSRILDTVVAPAKARVGCTLGLVTMQRRQRIARTLLIYACSPGLISLIAMVVAIRPLTAYHDGFHGPEAMWADLKRWARTGELDFPAWHRASRDHLHHRRAS